MKCNGMNWCCLLEKRRQQPIARSQHSRAAHARAARTRDFDHLLRIAYEEEASIVCLYRVTEVCKQLGKRCCEEGRA